MRWRAAAATRLCRRFTPRRCTRATCTPLATPLSLHAMEWCSGRGKKTKNPCEAVQNEAPVNTASTRRRPFVYPPGGGWLVFTKRVNSEHRVSRGGSEKGCLRDDPGCSRATQNRCNVKCMFCACCRGVNEELALSHQR